MSKNLDINVNTDFTMGLGSDKTVPQKTFGTLKLKYNEGGV